MERAPTEPRTAAPAVEISLAAPARDPLERMAAEVRTSLTAPRPWLSSAYFYDDRGSVLFEEITRLPEYYPTRTETEILERHADEILGRARPRELFELGSGSGRKTRRLVEAGRTEGSLEALTFFDVHRGSLERSLGAMGAEFPGLVLRGILGDFLLDLPFVAPADRRLAVFLGGTIGNLHPSREVPRFLRELAGRLGRGGAFLLGLDLEKDVAELEAAYDDAQGVTAEFNRNALRVVNARLGADFVPERWAHVAFYDRERRWIEMRLRATEACRVRVPLAGLDLLFAKGDEIRTEISCKYTRASFEARLPGTGLEIAGWWTDARGRFASALLVPQPVGLSGR